MKNILKKHEIRVNEIKKLFKNVDTDYDKLEEEICEIEYEVQGYPDSDELDALLRKITKIKEDNECYTPDDVLNFMFPNRENEDFDEDSMF